MFGFVATSCILCDALLDDGVLASDSSISLCQGCYAGLPRVENACKQCGEACRDCDIHSPVCGSCQKTPPPVDYTLCALRYISPIDYLVSELKFNKQLSVAAIMSQLLSEVLERQNNMPDLIVPVPLHKKRLGLRGFNQALEIAKPLSKKMNIPIAKNLLSRSKNTLPQSELDAKQRQRNIRNSFILLASAEQEIKNKHLVIVDDVVTTGATCNEVARLLKQAGAKTVGVWAVARA